jgi:hypothetical protein
MLLNCGDADIELEAFVDLMLFEFTELGVEAIEFHVELVDTAVKTRLDCGEIVLGRHVLDDETEDFADLLEGNFLWCHTRGVYHVTKRAHANSPDASRRGC